MVLSPTPAHESTLTVVKDRLTCMLGGIPVGSYNVYLETKSATGIRMSTGVSWIPDGVLNLWSEHNTTSWRLWLIESTFSQSDDDIMAKLRGYILEIPELLVACKILFKQAGIYQSPGVKHSVVKFLRSSTLLTTNEWKKLVRDEFADVVVDGHTWFSLSSVSIHVWVCLPDHGIDIDRPIHGSYSTGISTFTSCVYYTKKCRSLLSDSLPQHTTWWSECSFPLWPGTDQGSSSRWTESWGARDATRWCRGVDPPWCLCTPDGTQT